MNRCALLLSCALAFSCTDSGSDDTDSSGESGEQVGGVPLDPGELGEWLAGGGYSNWAAESGNHGSTGPHGEVRTFFNEDLVASFDAGNTTHPMGSASVKELYDGSGGAIGWAVMVKTEDGEDASSWYWYLDSSGSVTEGAGLPTCENCHGSDAAAVDRVLTPYPLQ